MPIHGHMHLNLRRNGDAAQLRYRADDPDTATAVQVVYVTLPQTFSGSAVMVTQTTAAAAPPATTADNKASSVAPTIVAPPSSSTKPATKPPTQPSTTQPSTTQQPTTASTTASAITDSSSDSLSSSSVPLPSSTTSDASTTSAASTAMAASTNAFSDPTAAVSTSAAATLAAAASSAAPSASSSSHSAGLSGGAAAGLAIGLLLGLGALGALLLVLHRRKKQMRAHQPVDDEKPPQMRHPIDDDDGNDDDDHGAMPPRNLSPQHDAAPVMAVRARSPPPRLSLRPVTQFSPALPGNQGSMSNALGLPVSDASHLRDSSPPSAWERVGASTASVPSTPRSAENPFGDPKNPFGSDAGSTHSAAPSATPSILVPGTPPSARSPSHDFSAMPHAASGKESPSPKKPATGEPKAASSPPGSGAIPASPGLPPTGPLPVAAAQRPASPPGPNNVHRVQLDFQPTMNDELEMHAGDLVRLLHEYDDGWALCVRLNRAQQGVVPRTCLSKHPVKPRNGPPRPGPAGSPRTRASPSAGSPLQALTPKGRSSPASPPAVLAPGTKASSRQRSNSSASHPHSPRSGSPGPYCTAHPKPHVGPGRRRSHSAGNGQHLPGMAM